MTNNFNTDSRCIEYWLFENNLTASKNGNDLVANAGGVGYSAVSPLEGSYSLDLESSSNQGALRTNANLSSNFPFKSTDTAKLATILVRIKPESSGAWRPIWAKTNYYWGATANCTHCSVDSGTLKIGWGKSAAPYNVDHNTGISIADGEEYHIAVVIDGIAPSLYVRVYRYSNSTVYTYSVTPGNELPVRTVDFCVGSWSDGVTNHWDGLIDELVVFNALLTDQEIDDIRDSIFGIEIPIVATNAVTNIDSDSALANGEVVSGIDITERGFVWSASVNPTTSDNKVTVAGTIGILSGTIFGLSDDTVYHVRCFATNIVGTGYGEDRSFQTLSIQYTEFEAMEERIFSKPIFIVTMGSFEVPQYDIIDLDQLTLSRADDFSVVTSDITITLNNNTGKYTPSRTNFIWVGESWYHQYFKLEFTYQDINEKYLLFEGYITKWNQKNTKDPAYDSAVDGSFVEVTAEDHCSMLEERMIGVPDDEGSPNPFVHGHIFRQAETLGPDVFWTASESIGYETGDLSEVDSVTGTGTTVITIDPYVGTYCAQHQDNAASAFCKQDVAPTGTDEFHVSAMIKFTAIPEVPLFNTLWFMGIYTTGNLNSINVNINTDGTTHDLIGIDMAGFGNVLSRVSISDYLDRWFKLDLITRNDLPNQQMVARLYLNGDDILTFVGSGSYPANNYRYAYWGLNFNSVVQSGWALCTDQINCYTVAYPYGYYLPGGAYQEINGIYVDGAFWPRKNKAHWNPYWNNGRFQFSYISYTGKGTLPENYRTNLNYCLVDFLDFDKEPNGSIIIDATKDNINHPVDQIQAILEAVDLDSRIDSSNFAVAKSINPDDTVGVYIDNQSAADGITSICQNTMNSFVERQGEFCIFPFTGQHMVDYERSLVESKYHSIEQATDMDNIKTRVVVTWGWYDNDKHLFYRIKNEDMIAIVGNQEAKLDLSYGQDVSSNNADMAKIKAGLLLNRYSGPIDEVIIKGNLSFIRIEIGYGVLIHSDFYETELIYEVIEKVIDFNDKTVELRCHRYLGNGIGQVFMGSSTIAPTVLIVGDSTYTGGIASSGEESLIGSIITNVDYAYLPYYSRARSSTVNPTFIYGNINYTPTQAESIGSSIDPTVAIS